MDYMKQIHAQMNNSRERDKGVRGQGRAKKGAIKTSQNPLPPDPTAVANWGVDYIVLTSVNRDN